MLAVQDFRANEKALQLLTQLSGRTGRKFTKGKIMIQTSQADHPVYKSFTDGAGSIDELLKERKEFDYPPFVRLVKITVRCSDREKLNIAANDMKERLPHWGMKDFSGPFSPAIDKIRGEYALQFWLKLPRSNNIQLLKDNVEKGIDNLIVNYHSSIKVSIDADPL
jgi:primosomal protein N' (replication factor Y)